MWHDILNRVLAALKVSIVGGLLVVTGGLSLPAFAADVEGNRLKSIILDSQPETVNVLISAYEPIGYRYTVYDSQDPRRIVVDFRGMDVSEISSPIISENLPVTEVRISSFDLTSGKLGRVEILLGDESDYNVTLDENRLKLSLASAVAAVPQVPEPEVTSVENVVAPISAVKSEDLATMPERTEIIPSLAEPVIAGEHMELAKSIQDVVVEDERVILKADGDVQIYKYFTLTGPTRLVVDVYKVGPAFKARAYSLQNGLKKLRVGVYKDKIRFVFDAADKKLPDFGVNKENNSVIVAWGGRKDDLSTPLPKPSAGPVGVQALDFYQADATSVFSVSLSDSFALIKPTTDGNIIRFGVQNATIGRELRRVFDSSAFPSSVRLVTPYTVQRPYGQDVMFAVDMKGPVEFALNADGNALKFVAQNESFNEVAPAPIELREVEAVIAKAKSLDDSMASSKTAEQTPSDVLLVPETIIDPASELPVLVSEPVYSGQKISLVFDNADIRDILQLIADVSDTNIIAGDDVSGSLTIRLVDVPWDQALAIVLDIKGLGMVESGNVVRIMPKDKIRDEETADLELIDQRRAKAPLETRVVTVSYTDVGEIATQITPMLTEGRGKITEDLRNKQVIVTDISDVLDQVEELVKVLDTPDRQVMIEARIVEANTTFSNDLGVSWGMTDDRSASASEGDLSNVAIGGGGGFLIAPPSTGSVGSSGLAADFLFGRLGIDNTILDLRLSALESTGNGKVVSSPRVTTLNGVQATIEQGTEIPYQSVDDSGQPKTEFKDATIRLTVTPQINPDQSILMKIDASNNSVGNIISTALGSVISLNKKTAKTSVLVKDGETTVIGGVFIESDTDSETGVPILKDIPILGHLFKSTGVSKERRELLIFVTPRILK